MVHPKHEERIKREPLQTICQSLVKIHYIYKNLICKSLQHCSVIQCWTRQSCGDIQSCGGSVLSPFTAARSTSTLPSRHLHRAWRLVICACQYVENHGKSIFWSPNIWRFGWRMMFLFTWIIFWVPAVYCRDVCLAWTCFSWVIINDHRFESWRFQWVPEMEIGLYCFFPGFSGPIKSTEMYMYIWFMVHAIHTSTDVYCTHLSFPLTPTPRRGRSFHTFSNSTDPACGVGDAYGDFCWLSYQ